MFPGPIAGRGINALMLKYLLILENLNFKKAKCLINKRFYSQRALIFFFKGYGLGDKKIRSVIRKEWNKKQQYLILLFIFKFIYYYPENVRWETRQWGGCFMFNILYLIATVNDFYHLKNPTAYHK